MGGNQFGDFMSLEMSPHIFDGIEVGRIGWQPLDLNASPGGGDVIFDHQAGMDGCSIREDQDFSGNMPLEMVQEFDHLKTFDAAGQNSRFQRAIVLSSCPMARRSGRWQLKPLAPGKRHTCPG